MRLLYVNNRLVDLRANTLIAQTLQVYEPGKVGSVATNYTSSIKAPRTSNNDITFEQLWDSKTKSIVPYSSLSCKYVENGLPIIRDARIVINEVNEKDYALSIYSGPWGFFEAIQNKTLWNLDFSDINGPWTLAARDGYRNTITGIVQALVDDGRLVQDVLSSDPTIENVETTLKPPQIYYHTVIEKIFSSFGFQFSGDIFNNDIFKKLVMPLSLIYNDPAFIQSKMFSASAPGTQVIANPITHQTILFNQNVKQGSDNFYDGTSSYIVSNSDTPDPYFRLVFVAELVLTVAGGDINIIIDGISGPPILVAVGSGTHRIGSSTGGRADGDVISIKVITLSGTPTVTVEAGSFYTQAITGTDGFEFFPTIQSGYVYFNLLFEKILITDFLKEFCVRFNLQMTQINNVIVCNTLNTILDRRTGPDWTLKRDKDQNRIRYSFSTYGKINVIKAPKDTEFSPDLLDNYADGSFEIPNENLKDSQTIYTSLFYPSQMITTFKVLMLNLNLGPDVANFARMPGNRLFFVREPYDYDPPVLYNTVDRLDYLVGYHEDPNQEYDMGWDFFIENFHKKYVEWCLRKVRLIERLYNLSDLDIFSFNQQIPIKDNNERFLVTKISNRVSGKLAKVELLKIEPNPAFFFTQGSTNEISGDLTDLMETLSDNIPFTVLLKFSLIFTDGGSPEWQGTFDATLLYAIGNGSFTEDSIPYVSSIATHVYKLNNDGNGTDGWPVLNGWVEWLVNGVQVYADSFNNSEPSEDQNLDFTFTGLNIGDLAEIIVHEDGTSP